MPNLDPDPKRISLDISQQCSQHHRSQSPQSTTDPSPALTHKSALSISNLELDLSLSSALSALIDHLLSPLNRCYTPTVLSALRLHLTSSLTELFAPSWDIAHPQYGSGFRSLICDNQHGLPKPLKESAMESGVVEHIWIRQLSKPVDKEATEAVRRRAREWEAWCDPGTVMWRYGGWEWEDSANDPVRMVREPLQIIWQASTSPKLIAPRPTASESSSTPNPTRTSHAIPIRAPVPLPSVFAIPPTPATQFTSQQVSLSTDLLPAAHFSRTPSPAHSEASSGYSSSTGRSDGFVSHQGTSQTSMGSSDDMTKPPSRGSHRGSGSGSTSSIESDNSGPIQPITPDARPASADGFPPTLLPEVNRDHIDSGTARGRDFSPLTPKEEVSSPGSTPTPTVTPYDGGNVTVLGGGVKLGGMSRPGSRTPHDRSRSPSISLASRALSSAMGPGQGNRKVRTRRRIMPTYLGHLGQPGVGGPIMGAFGMPPMPPGTWPTTNAPAGTGLGVGVGVGPPPVNPRGSGQGMPRMGS
ncbi:hypothetical protein BD324DRAFT_311814 [Kockovaella imperatae]|uniref:Anti-proliferative protein domain-containing protein n=1 Tax=Kockovaella imperatae TaxID=4999 RepID=A0A1Y1UPQ1_9TREE|nr:hypothetical protein BD324DRAFT_311814 [Kockovaella imperatae]ORX39115.1 hypothetical protein BD324DRAFT_311814 [Kockovaella imperatae]